MFRQLFERLPDIEARGRTGPAASPRSSTASSTSTARFTPARGAQLSGRRRGGHRATGPAQAGDRRTRGRRPAPAAPTPSPGPPFMEMATPIISATSSVVAPRRAAPRRVGGDAPVALPGDGDGERDELLRRDRKRALDHRRLVEGAVAGHDVGNRFGPTRGTAP